jgi:hypothetical protein
VRVLIASTLLLAACGAPPPPAPEGLDNSVRFIMNEFYADDPTFGAGLTGLLNWVDTEGSDLLDVDPNVGNVADFRLDTLLTADDTAQMPTTHGRDPSAAPGVVGLAELECGWDEGEQVHARPDQDVVFEDEWTRYDRTYESPRAPYEAAREAGEYPVVSADVDPATAVWDSDELAPVFMKTSNALGTSSVGIDFDYTLDLHFRHGVFDVQDEPVHAMVILTWLAESAESVNSDNFLYQVYSVDLIVSRGDGRGLRMVANYTEVGPVESNADLVQVLGVNRILDFAEHLNDICTGTRELPAE